MALAGLVLTGIVAGAVLGATTNAVNGSVSPLYFVNVLGWDHVADVQRAAIAQGILEGLGIGVVLSLVFTFVVGLISRASCPYGFGLAHLLGIVGATYIGWTLGGLAAVGLAALSPEFYRETIRGVPDDHAGMLRYAWVGGSISGAELTGLASVVLGLVLFRANWRRRFPDPASTSRTPTP